MGRVHTEDLASAPSGGLKAPPPAHTPGPWSITSVSIEDGSIGIAKDRVVIAYATNASSFGDFINATLSGRRDFGAPDTAKTQWANAHLIAAAPDLLAALKAVVAVADRSTDEFDAAHAAISKATLPSPSAGPKP